MSIEGLLNYFINRSNASKNAVNVELSGSNVTDGTGTLTATFAKDSNGNGCLRMVDAAPFAYDQATDSLKITSQDSGADRSVQEIKTHSAVAIRDTANHNSAETDVSALSGRKCILVNNSLDKAVTILLFAYASDSTVSKAFSLKTIASGGDVIIASDTGCSILQEPLQRVLIQAKCTEAPTTGTISIYIEGVPA